MPILFSFSFDPSVTYCCENDSTAEKVVSISNLALKKIGNLSGSKGLDSHLAGYAMGFEPETANFWQIPVLKLTAMTGHTLFSNSEEQLMCNVSLDTNEVFGEHEPHDSLEESLYFLNLQRANLIKASLAFLRAPLLLSVSLDGSAFEVASIYSDFASLPTSLVHVSGVCTEITHQIWIVTQLLKSNEIVHTMVLDCPCAIITSSFETVNHLQEMYNLREPLVEVCRLPQRLPQPVVQYGVRKLTNLVAPQSMISHFDRPANLDDIEVNQASFTHGSFFWEKLVLQDFNIFALLREDNLWRNIEVPTRHLSTDRYDIIPVPGDPIVVRENLINPLAIQEAAEYSSDCSSDFSDF